MVLTGPAALTGLAHAATPVAGAEQWAATRRGLAVHQHSRADQLIRISENSTTEIQHGNGSGYDALPALIGRTNDRVDTPASVGETAWLDAFFDGRIDDLQNPANSATGDE